MARGVEGGADRVRGGRHGGSGRLSVDREARRNREGRRGEGAPDSDANEWRHAPTKSAAWSRFQTVGTNQILAGTRTGKADRSRRVAVGYLGTTFQSRSVPIARRRRHRARSS